ncbi:MAG: DUF927 domain-containing protein [Sphingobacteriales bacterium]
MAKRHWPSVRRSASRYSRCVGRVRRFPLDVANQDGGGVHLRGPSSVGKTALLRSAASVYGPPSFLRSWRATANALEATAEQHTDTLLALDN